MTGINFHLSRKNPQAPCLVRGSKISSDLESKRNWEAISSGNIKKKKMSILKSHLVDGRRDSVHLHQRCDPDLMYPKHYDNDHSLDPGCWRSMESSPTVDSSSDTSSIFSFSDTGSYSTDSTKDSSAEDISGYIFGPRW